MRECASNPKDLLLSFAITRARGNFAELTAICTCAAPTAGNCFIVRFLLSISYRPTDSWCSIFGIKRIGSAFVTKRRDYLAVRFCSSRAIVFRRAGYMSRGFFAHSERIRFRRIDILFVDSYCTRVSSCRSSRRDADRDCTISEYLIDPKRAD